MAVELERLYLNTTHEKVLQWSGVIATSVTIFVFFFADGFVTTVLHKHLCVAVLALWALAPPLWFIYEYFYHFPKYGNPEAGFEKLKAAQEVSSKVWAAVSIVLAAVYAAKFSPV